jgi:L-amino acid N-acyltransferase YncA
VRIRKVSLEDATAIAKIYEPYVTRTAVSFESVAPDSDEMAGRISRVTEMYPWLVAEDDEGIAGYAYVSRHRDRHVYQWAIDSSVYIDPSRQRSGLGRRLYTELFGIAKRQGFTNVFAGITLPNEASVGLHRAMGFELVGIYKRIGFKFGAWHDTSWWQLSWPTEEDSPSDPVSWRELDLPLT